MTKGTFKYDMGWQKRGSNRIYDSKSGVGIDGVSPSVFRCTSTPMEAGPIDACVET